MKLKFIDAAGQMQEVSLSADVYRNAHEANLTVPQYLAQQYPTNPEKYGSTFDQLAASCGLFLSKDKNFGIRPPTLAEVFKGGAEINAGVVVRDASPASRILFPAVFLEAIEDKLKVDRATIPNLFDKMIAIDDTVAGNRIEQPVLNFSKPEAARSRSIAQGALPQNMLLITASDVARKIPTFALGVEITDEALKAVTLDFLSLSLARQAEVERLARVNEYINAFLNGDTDVGSSALSAVTTTSLDAAASGGVVTQKSWVKWLYRNSTKRVIDWVICDLDTALKIEGRTGKPVITGDDPNSPRIDSLFKLVNPSINSTVNMMVVEAGVVPASTVVGLDSRYAIRRIRNSEAEYTAAEQFVLKKTQALRFDFGEMAYRLYDEAWDVLTIA